MTDMTPIEAADWLERTIEPRSVGAARTGVSGAADGAIRVLIDHARATGVRAGHDEKGRGPEYRRGFADGRLAERAADASPDLLRLCPTCGHVGERGSAQVGPDEIGTWPVAADMDGGVYPRGDLALCSWCGTVTVAYVPNAEPEQNDQRWALLLQPDVLSALAAHVASGRAGAS